MRPDGYRGTWSVTARGPHPGRGKAPRTVTGAGDNEAAALEDLGDRLTGVAKPDGNQLEELRRRLRRAYLGGAEEWSRETRRRGLSTTEVNGVIRRFPADPHR